MISISSKNKERIKELEAQVAELRHENMVLTASVQGYMAKLQSQSEELEGLRKK